MSPLAPDEKSTMVMLYTQNALIRGEAITKENVRMSIWLRTDAAPRYIHIVKPQVISSGGGALKVLNYAEIYVPVSTLIAFHLAPPAQVILDYDENEKNRAMESTFVEVGSFLFKGILRFSAQSGFGGTLEMAKMAWMSMYSVEITNPNLPHMPPIVAPMALISPGQVSFAR